MIILPHQDNKTRKETETNTEKIIPFVVFNFASFTVSGYFTLVFQCWGLSQGFALVHCPNTTLLLSREDSDITFNYGIWYVCHV